MRALPANFRRKGMNYQLMLRTGAKAMYSIDNGESYEVIKIRHTVSRQIGSKTIQGGEYFPPSESWGVYGWTFVRLERAKQKYNDL